MKTCSLLCFSWSIMVKFCVLLQRSSSKTEMLLLQRIYSTNIVCFVLDKTRQDIYYHNIVSKISWHADSKKKTLVEVGQINPITNQILQKISKKQRKKKRINMCNKFKSKKVKSVKCNLWKKLRFRILQFYFSCYHGCIKVIIFVF